MLHKDNPQPKKRLFLKFSLIGCGTILLLAAAFFIWIGVSLFSGPDVMEMSEFHPFRSQEAKAQYLKWYDERFKIWPVASETKMVETSYGQTFVRISGQSDAPPLVLLPGGGSTMLCWLANIEALSENHRTYALDNINDYGRSVFNRPIENADDYVQWLDELFIALELGDNINLMGLSYGGWITSQYAIRHPDRLDKIVLLAPAATVLSFTPEFIQHAALTLIPHRYFFKRLMYWLLEDLANKDEAGLILIETTVDDAMLARRCFKFKMLVNPAVLSDNELQSLKMPVLFLVGENEKIYSAQKAVQRLNLIAPQIKTEIIPDCGHDIFITQSEIVNQRVLQFLEQADLE